MNNNCVKKEETLSSGITLLREELKTIPSKPGVYKFLDSEKKVLYIGKAKNLFKRVSFYTQPKRLNTRLTKMIGNLKSINVEITNTEIEALLLESNLIKKFQPIFNILLKDDKSFSSIYISTQEEFPQISSHRGKKDKVGEYFGPFISRGAIYKTLETIQKIFLLRNCADSIFYTRKRPCLQYQIKRCSAPCVNLINKDDYRKKVSESINFLSGNTKVLKDTIAEQMRIESSKQNYEKAAIYRNRLQALADITAYQTINNENIEDLDVLIVRKENRYAVVQTTIFRSGSNYGSTQFFPKINQENTIEEILEAFISQFYNNHLPPKLILVNCLPKNNSLIQKFLSKILKSKSTIQIPKRGLKLEILNNCEKNALEVLNRKIFDRSSNRKNLELFSKKFNIKNNLNKIEVYDNSHIQGSHSIGAMISFSEEGFLKSSYRKFNFSSVEKKNLDLKINNDYLMMEEMIKRRFKKNSTLPFPEVVIIDGGKGHLKIVSNIMNKLSLNNIFLLAIAKGNNRNDGNEKFYINSNQFIELDRNDPLRFFIQNLRDEAHRFAIGVHRNKRNKNLFFNPLDEINGIGQKRKQNLLNYFGSAKAVKKASLTDLLKVPNLNKKTAQTIYNFFNDS